MPAWEKAARVPACQDICPVHSELWVYYANVRFGILARGRSWRPPAAQGAEGHDLKSLGESFGGSSEAKVATHVLKEVEGVTLAAIEERGKQGF